MFEDIVESRNRAMILQKWNEGERYRIGHPFQWVDAAITPGWERRNELDTLLKYFTMFYEDYPTPEVIETSDFGAVFDKIHQDISRVFKMYFPWPPEEEYDNYLKVLAKRRTEDYGFIRTFGNLGRSAVRHLDIGPGLGSHATYSRHVFDSCYCGLEAYPESYEAQRNFFRALSSEDAPYVDFVATEIFGVADSKCTEMLRNQTKGIFHVPSWKFPVIDDGYFDLVTATWVLNEISPAGIIWLISGSVRTMKVGGYFYIRDSGKRKPGRHDVDYDALLLDLGFSEAGRLDVQNRVDFHGVPRMYQKTSEVIVPSYDDLVDRIFGHFGTWASTAARD